MSDNPTLLVIARLTVSSSYARQAQQPAADDFDTVQLFLPGDRPTAYRIRTFAQDHDIHVHQLDWTGDRPPGFIEDYLHRTYGDLLVDVRTIELTRLSTEDLVDAGVTTGQLETVEDSEYRFWNPDGGDYRARSQPDGAGERPGMREVLYLGGIARFWLPSTWSIQESPDHGGQFSPPDGRSVLRLNVVTFDTSAVTDPVRHVPHALKPTERGIDSGRLDSGYDFDVYERDDPAEGTRLRFWQITQVLDGQCRIYVFAYAYPVAAADDKAEELAMVDHEVRHLVPYPQPV